MNLVSGWFGVKFASKPSQSYENNYVSNHSRSRRRYALGSTNLGSSPSSDEPDENASTHQLSDLKNPHFGQPPGHEPIVVHATSEAKDVEAGQQTENHAITVKYEVNMTFSERQKS